MTLTAEQQKKVEQNIRLVQKVINDGLTGLSRQTKYRWSFPAS